MSIWHWHWHRFAVLFIKLILILCYLLLYCLYLNWLLTNGKIEIGQGISWVVSTHNKYFTCVHMECIYCTYPSETDTGDGPTKHISHNGWIGVSSREVGVEARRMPVGNPRHYNTFDVSHHRCPRLGLLRRLLRNQRAQIPRFYGWHHLSGKCNE